MDAKEKAQELYKKFEKLMIINKGDLWKRKEETCKLFADEIMSLEAVGKPHEFDDTHYDLIFWKQVKEEINKL